MDTKRAETFQALSTFIQSQKTLLSRNQDDIDRLKELKRAALAEPDAFVSNLSHELHSQSYRLSEQWENASVPLEQIDWSLYASQDPTPLRDLAASKRSSHAEKSAPRPYQRGNPSELQHLVHSARRTLLDPVFARLPPLPALHSDSEESVEEVDPAELKRERAREKIRELKKRKIGGSSLTVASSAYRTGVFIRRDQMDESALVEVTSDEVDGGGDEMDGGSGAGPSRMAVDLEPSANVRTRRPTTKLKSAAEPPRKRSEPPRKRSKTNTEPDPAPPLPKNPPPPNKKPPPPPPPPPLPVNKKASRDSGKPKPSRDSTKPKPETYKQAWSVSEQHLLERLLDEVPEGEKNRCVLCLC
ncbi:hypothetical protein PLICRDRAFT_38344 [Plicaturopsis crispa FD-325 SS-3]|nr:hypothetical protein PLICRDRAFT_38344 [Plicaturopsis crispa FD-325 SS-3]